MAGKSNDFAYTFGRWMMLAALYPSTHNTHLCIYSRFPPQVALFCPTVTPKTGKLFAAGTSMAACVDLQENEHAISLDVMMFGNAGEEKPYVIVGTGWLTSQGEDSMPKGRLLIYEVSVFRKRNN